VEKTGKKRPWKSFQDFHFSHSFNNNKLDDRDHFLQNEKTNVASLRRLITPTRNADHDQPGTPITFIGIRIQRQNFFTKCPQLPICRVTGQLAHSTRGAGANAASKIGFPSRFRVQVRPKLVNLGVILGVGSQ